MIPRIVLLLALALPLASPAGAQKRVALVIGNGAYAQVGKLPNPARDAEAIESLLRAAGFFAVQRKSDLGVREMRRALRDFSDLARDADVAVVFFAGHGMEVNGANYLIPVDATLERDIDVEDETVSLDRVMQLIEQARRLRVVILDACRNNPFLYSMQRTGRAIGRGLAKVEILSSDTLVAFAAKHGSTAADGAGANSPYTLALLNHLTTPGLDIRLALGRVRDEVLKASGNLQEPFLYGSLGGTLISLSSTAPAEAPLQAGGLFSERHAVQLKNLAGNLGLTLPTFELELPTDKISSSLRRFVGIWNYKGDREAQRNLILITTRIDRDGEIQGHLVYGTTVDNAPVKIPRGDFRFESKVADDSFQFFDPAKTRSFALTLREDGRMELFYLDNFGLSRSATLEPVWTLENAEQSSKR